MKPKTDDANINSDSQPAAEDQQKPKQDRHYHFSTISRLENGARQWVQDVGRVVQDMNHRQLSTDRADLVRPQPFAGTSGLIRCLIPILLRYSTVYRALEVAWRRHQSSRISSLSLTPSFLFDAITRPTQAHLHQQRPSYVVT